VSASAEHPEVRQARARSRGYLVLARLFDYPDAELGRALRTGELAERLREVLAEVDPALAEELDTSALAAAGEDDELEVEFTRLFDVGPGGPPCPLYGGLYGGARAKTLEETVRFYNHFGLGLAEAPRELRDHLGTELEFLHFLAFREAEALEAGADPSSYRRAARDFLARHPLRWVPKLRRRLDEEAALPCFAELARLLERFLERDLRHLVARLGAPAAAQA
jgi:DMSO reductase family type II enzyme chaperone